MKRRFSAVGLVLFLCAGVCAIVGFGGTPVKADAPPDTTAPDTSFTVQPPSPISDLTIGIAFTGTDETTAPGNLTFECAVDTPTFTACTSPYAFTVAPGNHTVSVRAIDEANNVDPTPATSSWFVDGEAPNTTIDTFPLFTTTSPTFTFSGTDNVTPSNELTFNCSVDGEPAYVCTSPLNLSSDTSPHTLTVAAVDQFFFVDQSRATFTWNLDNDPPDTSFFVAPPSPIADTNVGAAFVGTDDSTAPGDLTFECAFDTPVFTPCVSPVAFTNMTLGTHTLAVRAIDLAGRVDPTPASTNWYVDGSAPNTTIDSAPTGITTSPSFTFSGVDDSTAPGALTFVCTVDGGGEAPCTSPISGTSDTAPHTFTVAAIDQFGHKDATPASFTWNVDTTPPDTTYTVAPPSPITETTIGAAFTGTDDATAPGGLTFQCSLDGAGFGTCTSPLLIVVGTGTHTLAVKAKDAAGNEDPTPAFTTWHVDSGPPETTIDSAPTGITTSPSFTFSGVDDSTAPGALTFVCTVDGGGEAPCTSPISGTSDTAPHTFTVAAIDQFGRKDATPASYTWNVDTTPPDTTYTVAPPSPIPFKTIGAAFTGSDNVTPSGSLTFECSLDGAQFESCVSPVVITVADYGTHTYAVRAIDAAGNIDPTPAFTTWVVDPNAFALP